MDDFRPEDLYPVVCMKALAFLILMQACPPHLSPLSRWCSRRLLLQTTMLGLSFWTWLRTLSLGQLLTPSATPLTSRGSSLEVFLRLSRLEKPVPFLEEEITLSYWDSCIATILLYCRHILGVVWLIRVVACNSAAGLSVCRSLMPTIGTLLARHKDLLCMPLMLICHCARFRDHRHVPCDSLSMTCTRIFLHALDRAPTREMHNIEHGGSQQQITNQNFGTESVQRPSGRWAGTHRRPLRTCFLQLPLLYLLSCTPAVGLPASLHCPGPAVCRGPMIARSGSHQPLSYCRFRCSHRLRSVDSLLPRETSFHHRLALAVCRSPGPRHSNHSFNRICARTFFRFARSPDYTFAGLYLPQRDHWLLSTATLSYSAGID